MNLNFDKLYLLLGRMGRILKTIETLGTLSRRFCIKRSTYGNINFGSLGAITISL